MEKKLIVKDLLKQYGLYSEKLSHINFHLNIFYRPVEDILIRLAKQGIITIPENATEEQLAVFLSDLIKKCDADNPDYDSKLDVEMTRIGMLTDLFPGDHHSNNKWNTGFFEDDGFGLGMNSTSSYMDDDNNRSL